MSTTTLLTSSTRSRVASDSVRHAHRHWVAASDSSGGTTVEALHKSEIRSCVDDGVATTSSAGRQRCRPVVHPHFERHGS